MAIHRYDVFIHDQPATPLASHNELPSHPSSFPLLTRSSFLTPQLGSRDMKRQTKKVNLDVPKGVEAGMTMKMTGQGVEAAVGNAVGTTLCCMLDFHVCIELVMDECTLTYSFCCPYNILQHKSNVFCLTLPTLMYSSSHTLYL